MISEKSVLSVDESINSKRSHPPVSSLICLKQMMDNVPRVSFEKEFEFLQMSKIKFKSENNDRISLRSENSGVEPVVSNLKLENLFNMWLPNKTEPLIVSYSEHFKVFKGLKLRIINLRDLTADFKVNE